MYSKIDLLKDLDKIGIKHSVSKDYGRGSVIELDLDRKYKFVVAESNIAPENPCFWGVTRNVIDKLIKDDQDFALVLMDTKNKLIYAYDRSNTKELLKTASIEKENMNYRITDSNVVNPIDHESFYEFIRSLK